MAKTECTWNRRANIEHKEARGTSLHSRDLIFSLSLSICVSPSLSQVPPPPGSTCSLIFRILFPPSDEKKWKEHLHTWVNKAHRCVGGELWEANGVCLFLSLSVLLTRSLLGLFLQSLCLYWKLVTMCEGVCVQYMPVCWALRSSCTCWTLLFSVKKQPRRFRRNLYVQIVPSDTKTPWPGSCWWPHQVITRADSKQTVQTNHNKLRCTVCGLNKHHEGQSSSRAGQRHHNDTETQV